VPPAQANANPLGAQVPCVELSSSWRACPDEVGKVPNAGLVYASGIKAWEKGGNS